MHRLLATTVYSRGTHTNPRLAFLMEKQRLQLERVIQHYHQLGRAVNGRHPLARIVAAFNPPPDGDALDVYGWAVDNLHTLANTGNVTTSSMVQHGVAGLYYNDSYDYHVANSKLTFADAMEFNTGNWTAIDPVTVLSHSAIHPLSHYPEGNNNTGEHYSIIGVDIPALALMWHWWRKDNARLPEDLRETSDHFIGRYVLGNMIASQTNASLVNLGLVEHHGLELPKEENRVGLNAIKDYWPDILKQRQVLDDDLMGKNLRPSEYLSYLPAIQVNQSLFSQRPQVHGPEVKALYHLRLAAHLNITLLALINTGMSGSVDHLKTGLKAMRRSINNYRPLDKFSNRTIRERMASDLDFIDMLV